MNLWLRSGNILLAFLILPLVPASRCSPQVTPTIHPPQQSAPTLSALISTLRTRSQSLQSAPGVRRAYDGFLAERHLVPGSVSYSDFVLVRTTFEATRDAGFWNLHWSVTDQPPNSDRIWSQWKTIVRPSFTGKTATAECDELSALFAFLLERSGLKGVGLLWPYPNHTVAVWSVHRASGPAIRVVIPTSQIFLTENDTFDTHKFDPWRQKTIYDYTRHDVPDSFELPKPLFDFFQSQLDKYGGVSTDVLQQIRNLREAVFQGSLTAEQAASEALRRSAAYASSQEDRAAFQHFADDIRSTSK
jgi:hypothetical protein